MTGAGEIAPVLVAAVPIGLLWGTLASGKGLSVLEAVMMSALIGSVIGLLFFLTRWRTGWPWLLTSAFFFLDGYLQTLVAQSDRTKSLTLLVSSIGRAPAFGLSLLIFAALLWAAWRVEPAQRKSRQRVAEPIRS